MECGSDRDIRLLEHGMRFWKETYEARLRKVVKIDNMQFGFVPGRETTDAVVIVCQLQEKHLAQTKGPMDSIH